MKAAMSLPVVLIGITGMLACREPRAAVPEGALARYQLAGTPTWRVTLPASLHEISGLAVTGDGRVFTHGDEDATVHQIDPRAGEARKRFSLAPTGDEPDLGKKPAKDRVAGDFQRLGPGVHAGRRTLAVLAGPQRFFAEVTSEGGVVGGGALPRETHPQPESIAFRCSSRARAGRATRRSAATRRGNRL